MNEAKKYIKQALKLAKMAHPSPNPRVGAVIVNDGRVIGQGYHMRAGEAHAEMIALEDAKQRNESVDGATLYVTLEPCSHHNKRTPPCTDALIDSRIKNVVIGTEDRNPLVQGIEKLKEAGIAVEVVNNPQCYELNEGFFQWIRVNRPFVMLKLAMTLDGRIATKTGDSKYISNSQSRALSYAWRDDFDAILVGIKTVLADDPKLTSHNPKGKNPARIVVDSHLRIPLTSKVLEPTARRILATTAACDLQKKKQLEEMGVELLLLPSDATNHVDLNALLDSLGKMGITSLIVEGGSEIATAVLEQKLAQKAAFFISAKILGAGKNAFEGVGVEKVNDALPLRDVSIRKLGDDVLIMGYF